MSNELVAKLQARGVRFVRFTWCDNANVIRAKAVHSRFLAEHFDGGVGVTAAHQAVPVMGDTVIAASGLGPVGEVWLVPESATLMPLPYAPGHARVHCDMVQDHRPWPYSPRHFLKTILAELRRDNLEVMASFENEFFLLRPTPDGGFVPSDRTAFAATYAMDENRAVIDDLVEALIAQGLPVEMYYPESGPGQQEIPLRYTHALEAADRQIAFRETAHAIAARHGLKASFLPKIFPDEAGSGCHVHFSLWSEGKNLLPEEKGKHQLSGRARAFMAGILQHLPALMALTTPTCNSFRRIRPHCWSGAFRCWGMDNREAALRVPSAPLSPGPSHFEVKTVDASANPYLALGALVAAGLDGLRRQLDLPDPVAVDPGNLPEPERLSRGIDPLPTSLAEALAHLRQDQLLLDSLGAPLAQSFLTVREAERQAFKDLELADEVKLLLERY